jgi:N-acetylneuraminic acid mutarotase
MLRSGQWRAGLRIARTFTSALSVVLLGLCFVTGASHAAAVRTAGPLSGNLQGATVTLTDADRILIFGGGTATLWNPQLRRWEHQRTAEQEPRRYLHTATVIGGQRVIFAGGLDTVGSRRGQQTALASTTVWRAGQDVWEAGPGLLAPRFAHAAVALPTDDVLVIGGASSADQDEPFGPLLATVELLGEKTTIERAPISAARIHHTATLLKDGRVMVIGGIGDDRVPLASVELYDPQTNQWHSGPALAIARSGHTANLLPDGRVLVTGGTDSAGNSVGLAEIWSAETAHWQPAGELLAPRSGHAATTLPDGSVLLSGGTSVNHEFAESLEIWHAVSSSWEPAGELPLKLSNHRAVLAPDGSVLLFGTDAYAGGSVLAWLPHERENLLPFSTLDGSLTELADGRFVLVGGQRRQAHSASAIVYDPRTNHWTSVAAMHYPRSRHRALRLADGRLLVVGGEVPGARKVYDGDKEPASIPAEIWDPRTNQWSLSASLKYASGSWAEPTLLADGRVKLAAVNNQESHSDVLEYYRIWDPRDDSVTSLAHVRRTRPGGNALLYPDGHLLHMGGEDQTRASTTRACTAVEEDGDPTDDRESKPKQSCTPVVESARDGKRLDYWDANHTAWREAEPAPASLNLMETYALDDGGVLAWKRPSQPDDLKQPMLRWQPARGWQTIPVPSLLTAGASLRAATLSDGELLLVVAGQHTLLWRPEEHEWIPIAQETSWDNIPRIVNAADGRTLAFHDVQMPGRSFTRLAVAWLNIEARRWQPNTNDFIERDYPATLALSDKKVMVAGGASAVVQIWSPETGEWRYTGFLPTALIAPAALKLHDGGVMVAGKETGKEATVGCARWEPTSEEWSPCGEFPSDADAERRPVVLRYLSGDQILLVHGNEHALVRDADGTWVATKLDFPKVDSVPVPNENGTPYATDIGSVWDPQVKEWKDATDVLLMHRHGLRGGLTPEGVWLFTLGDHLLQWRPGEKIFSSIALDQLPERSLNGLAVTKENCIVLWNNTRDLASSIDVGGYLPALHARDLNAKVWSAGADASVVPMHAGAVTLQDGTVLLAGRSRDELTGGSNWQSFNATCNQVTPVAPERTLYLPTRTGGKPESTQTSRSSSISSAQVHPDTSYLSTWKATTLALMETARRDVKSTLILGGLLVFMLIRLADRGSPYYIEESGRVPGRVIDVAILLASVCMLLLASGAPWPAARAWVIAAAASAVAIAARRLWNNIETLRDKRVLALPLGACAALSTLTIGSITTYHIVELIEWLRS